MGTREFDEVDLKLVDHVTVPAKRAASALERLLDKFPRLGSAAGAAARGIQSTFGRLASSLKGVFARPLGVIGTSLSTMFGNLASDAVRFGIGAAKGAAGGLVRMVDSAADARRALTAAFGTLERGNEALLMSRKILSDMGGGLDTLGQIREIFSTSGRMGLSPAEADMIARFRFDLEGLGVTAERADGVIDKLFRAGATGTLNRRVLGELGEAGFEKTMTEEGIAARMGISLEKFRQLGEDEIIPFGAVMSELMQQTVNKSKKKLGEAGAAVGSYTLGGLAEDVKGKFVARLEQALDTSGSGGRIITAAQGLADKLGAAIESGKLDEWLTRVSSKLEEWGQKLSAFDTEKFVTRLNEVAGAIGTIASLAERAAKAFAVFNGDTSVKASEIFGATEGGAAQKILDFTPNQAIDIISSFWGDFFTSGKNLGNASASGVAAGLAGGQAGVEKAAATVAGAAAQASAQELKIHSPSRVFFEQGEDIDAGLAEGMTYNDLALQSAEDVARGVSRTAALSARADKPNYVGMGKEAARTMAAAGAGAAGASMHIDAVEITVQGASDPQATAELVYSSFEERIGAYFDRLLQGSGA